MAKITKVQSGKNGNSYKITLPKLLAELFIEKYGTEVEIKPYGKGFKILPKEV